MSDDTTRERLVELLIDFAGAILAELRRIQETSGRCPTCGIIRESDGAINTDPTP